MSQSKNISGFYENLPEDQLIEEKFKEVIKKHYALSGFTFIAPPAIERSSVLLSKGSDDHEIYGVKRLKADNTSEFDMGLRFDLTVPLARYVSQYAGNLDFPFKTQHIGKSWRGERPQKGRFREFYQADIDIISHTKLPLLADVEVISTIYNALMELDFGEFCIHINNRKILIGFLEALSIPCINDTIAVIDKKDKHIDIIPLLEKLSLNSVQIENITKLINSSHNNKTLEILSFFDHINNSLLEEGIAELTYTYSHLLNMGVKDHYIKINPSIARGLNYYTGLIFETFISGNNQAGSIASGGRYENLCSNFTKSFFPGVGGSIGISRLLSILKDSGVIIGQKKTVSQVLVLYTGGDHFLQNLELLNNLRSAGIATELYLDETAKISKQMRYANNKKIPYVIIHGDQEALTSVVQIKTLSNGMQQEVAIKNLITYMNTLLNL